MNRRHFLRSSAFFTIAAASGTLAACSSDDDAPAAASTGASTAPAAGVYSFPQGVASGDPRGDSIVFWTRAVARSGATAPVSLQLQVSPKADFSTLAAQVALQALPDFDFTVRAKVTGLNAAATYYYRFVAGGDVSAAGTAKTAPAAGSSVSKVRFAWFTCQDWTVNHWQALSLIAAESDLDFVVHLGDYIYESVGASFQAGAAEPAHTQITLPDGIALPAGAGIYANSLADYRTLYRTYRSDARLQTVHQRFAMIPIWDDHEFSDDCWQDHQTYTNANAQQTSRRRSASQAWAEYMPIDWSDVQFNQNNPAYTNISIYRSFSYGNLMDLVMTDERLFRDQHVMSEQIGGAAASQLGLPDASTTSSVGVRYFVTQNALSAAEALDTAALGRAPSILGPTQTQWFKQKMSGSTATWKVWGNEVMLNRLWIDLTKVPGVPSSAAFNYIMNCDSWDGYPSHKADVLGYLKQANVQNVVAITGDLHAFQAGVVRDVPDPATGTPVLVDFVSAGISSSSFYSYIQQQTQGTQYAALLPLLGVTNGATFDATLQQFNPDLAYADHDAQGYASATVTADTFSVVYTKVKPLNSDGTAPANPVAKRVQLSVANNSHTIQTQVLSS
ncbi:alkaline phosphatase D family protein [Burkholderia sp. Ac-20379]|uniref:alkaline phosphatase D family protein n=1 Tax=Burkholderia sp. Ac-20379 TaxID=2703900 RepID=UPI00198091D5|nr:alkaline phosphatase D family protein [Burkholderia sp. Ac-20379]MBN3722612.1 alkaline phosphatase [Burkholderia sp. Ac-20379]